MFFLLAGWQKGFLLSLLGVARVVLAYGCAFLAGRYLGFWLGEIAHRPRIVTIPVLAGLTFVFITFIFHVIMTNIRDEHRDKEEKEDFRLPWPSCLGGSAINLGVGLFSAIFLFWLADVFLVGMTGHSIPGANRSKFGGFARRDVYESVNVIIARDGRESQAAATARVVSDPAQGMRHLENVISAESTQQLLSDQELAKDVMRGDAARVEGNAALQASVTDHATLTDLNALGIRSAAEKKTALCEKLAKFGSNENILISLESLQARQLLSTDKITALIRDPEFDAIVGELLK